MEQRSTSDIFKAAFLAAYGRRPALEKIGSRVLFFYQHDEQLEQLFEAYEIDSPVPIQTFIENYRRLRSRMYEMRGSG